MIKIVVSFFLISITLFGKWSMFQSKSNTFIYNEETGEVFRHYQVLQNKEYLKEEGFVRVKFTTFTKYPINSQFVAPTGNTPKEMKAVEKKMIEKLSK